MHVEKKLNVMRTNVVNPSNEWCKEAYENADVIWYDGKYFYRMSEGIPVSYFVCVIPTNNDVTFYRLLLNGVNYTVSYYVTKINYSQS